MRSPSWSWEEQLGALGNVTWGSVLERAAALRASAQVTCLAHGDVQASSAVFLGEKAAVALGRPGSAPALAPLRSLVAVPPRGNLTELRSHPMLPGDANSAVVLVYQLDPTSGHRLDACSVRRCVAEERQASALLLLSQVASQRAFDKLRTKESLGYVVWLWPEFTPVPGIPGNDVMSLQLLVQSSSKGASEVRQRMTQFLDDFLLATGGEEQHTGDGVPAITEAEVEAAKEGLRAALLQRPDNLAGEGARIWNEVLRRRDGWDRPWLLADALVSLTLHDLQDLLRRLLRPSGAARKLAIEVWRTSDGDPMDDQVAPGVDVVAMDDLAELQRWKCAAGNWSPSTIV